MFPDKVSFLHGLIISPDEKFIFAECMTSHWQLTIKAGIKIYYLVICGPPCSLRSLGALFDTFGFISTTGLKLINSISFKFQTVTSNARKGSSILTDSKLEIVLGVFSFHSLISLILVSFVKSKIIEFIFTYKSVIFCCQSSIEKWMLCKYERKHKWTYATIFATASYCRILSQFLAKLKSVENAVYKYCIMRLFTWFNGLCILYFQQLSKQLDVRIP